MKVQPKITQIVEQVRRQTGGKSKKKPTQVQEVDLTDAIPAKQARVGNKRSNEAYQDSGQGTKR